MVLGHRKALSFDTKKIKALQNKIQGILQVINSPAKVAAQQKFSSAESSSELESSSSSESSSDTSSKDGLIPEGQNTPSIPPSSAHAATLPARICFWKHRTEWLPYLQEI